MQVAASCTILRRWSIPRQDKVANCAGDRCGILVHARAFLLWASLCEPKGGDGHGRGVQALYSFQSWDVPPVGAGSIASPGVPLFM